MTVRSVPSSTRGTSFPHDEFDTLLKGDVVFVDLLEEPMIRNITLCGRGEHTRGTSFAHLDDEFDALLQRDVILVVLLE